MCNSQFDCLFGCRVFGDSVKIQISTFVSNKAIQDVISTIKLLKYAYGYRFYCQLF